MARDSARSAGACQRAAMIKRIAGTVFFLGGFSALVWIGMEAPGWLADRLVPVHQLTEPQQTDVRPSVPAVDDN